MTDLLTAPTEAAFRPMDQPPIDARVVLLTHYIPLYQVRVLQEIARRVRDFHVLLSTPLEPNRNFEPDWGGLDVRVQKNVTLRRRWRDRGTGFQDSLYVHVPYDTLSQLRRLRPDVVMSLELGARSLAAAAYRIAHPRSRLVLCTYMSEHTERSRGWTRRMIRKPLLRRADAVTYNGPSCYSYLRQQGVSDQRLFPLPYAADDRTVHRGPVARDEAVVRGRLITVGQLTERKGVLPLVQQLVRYAVLRPQRALTLTVAGEGPLRDALSAIVLPENLHVELTGNLTPSVLAQHFAQQGAAVLPTLADEWLLVANEALQAGLPLLGSEYAQAVTSLVQPGINGWRYDPLQPESLHGILDQYFSKSDSEIAAMRTAARDSVRQRTPAWAASGAIDAIRAVRTIAPSS